MFQLRPMDGKIRQYIHRRYCGDVIKFVLILEVKRISPIEERRDELSLTHSSRFPVNAFMFQTRSFYSFDAGLNYRGYEAIFGKTLGYQIISKHSISGRLGRLFWCCGRVALNLIRGDTFCMTVNSTCL